VSEDDTPDERFLALRELCAAVEAVERGDIQQAEIHTRAAQMWLSAAL
jgi:hypothetical protein